MFVTGDLSQIELRVAGILSEDEVINNAYRNGEDLHRNMAAKMSGKNPKAITKAERTAAKAVNFGLLFGAGAATLQQQAASSYGVEMTLEEAEDYRELFFETYPQFYEWQQDIVEATNLYEFVGEQPDQTDPALRQRCLHPCHELPDPVVCLGGAGTGDPVRG